MVRPETLLRRPIGSRRARLAGALALLIGSTISAWALFGGTELWSVVSYCSAQHQAIGIVAPILAGDVGVPGTSGRP